MAEIPNDFKQEVPKEFNETPLQSDGHATNAAQSSAISERMTGKNTSIENVGFSGAKDILDPTTMDRKDIVDLMAANDTQIASLSAKDIPNIENKMAAVQAAMEKAELERTDAAIVAANNANK